MNTFYQKFDLVIFFNRLSRFGCQNFSYDFNLDFPEIIQGKKVTNEPENKGHAIKEEVSFWKEKYFTLLEEYNALLKQELGKK